MRRDKSAIQGGAGRGLVPQAELLCPFASWLTGDVLVVGDSADGIRASLSAVAASVVASADASAISQAARFDAVVLAGSIPSLRPAARRPQRLDGAIAWARSRLRGGGRLILAVDNALSLRGLSRGAEEDGRPGLPSLEARARADGMILPTRESLRRSLHEHGLIHHAWWFPFPDRGLPLSLVAEAGFAGFGGFDPGALAAAAAGLDPDAAGETLFSTRRAWRLIARQGVAADLAPAFLVAASDAPLPEDGRLAIHRGLRRRPEFERLVTFEAEGTGVRVRRTRLNPGLPATVDGVSNLFPSEAFVPGRLWSTALDEILARDGWCLDAVAAWAEGWRDAVARTFAAGTALEPDTRLPAPALDAIPKNLVSGDTPAFIDLEWDLGAPLDAGHLAVRGLVNALTDAQACGRPVGPVPRLLDALRHVLPKLGMPLDDAELADRLARESRFQSIVSGRATRRDLDWAATTRLPVLDAAGRASDRAAPRAPPTDPAAEIARLRAENEALRVAREAAEAEGARRIDRVVAYAADLHRARDRLQGALDAALARGPGPTPAISGADRDPTAAPWRHGDSLPRRLRRFLGGRT